MYSNYAYCGLPTNFTNGQVWITAKNGMKLTPDAFWFLYEINRNIMEMTDWMEV